MTSPSGITSSGLRCFMGYITRSVLSVITLQSVSAGHVTHLTDPACNLMLNRRQTVRNVLADRECGGTDACSFAAINCAYAERTTLCACCAVTGGKQNALLMQLLNSYFSCGGAVRETDYFSRM